MRTISASVGQGGTNTRTDASTVQELLNKVPVGEGGPQTPLKVDGLAWGKTIAAIKRFQSINMGHKWPDGRVDPVGKTLARLNDYDDPAPTPLPNPAPPPKQYIWAVPGTKWLVGQPNMFTCWAAVYTMMRSWREGKLFPIAEALEKPGQQYVDLFLAGRGLLPSQFRDFWTRGGLTVRGVAAAFPDYIWFDLLSKHGLLAVGDGNSLPPNLTGLHLRVLQGMSVRNTPSDSYFIMDPGWGGKQYPEAPFEFEAKYNLAMTFGQGADWQIAHYY